MLEKWEHERWLKSLEFNREIRMFGIWAPEHGPVGVCGLTDIDMVNRTAEFSLYIDPHKQGHSYGTEALKELIWYGFQVLNLNHIFGETFEGNPAISMFEKLGFKKDGTRRSFYYREGEYVNAHLYSILRSEYQKCSET